ncbi:hypothetical protein IMZ68_02740, partial [Candidatus Bathyarchaeota archaeon]|nr:hypothetical protein [Candidatus Bathyarchaeota archaeon]
LIALEDLIGEAYTTYVQSPATKILADELSKIVTVDLNNFKKIFETFVEQKEKHRETIIEIMYCYEAKEADRLRHIAPLIKYQNPDSWIRQSTLHAFSNTPVKENTAP